MLVKSVIKFYTRILNSIFISFIIIFYLSSCSFCSDSFSHVKKYNGFSFDKKKIYRYSNSECYIMKGRTVYKKTGLIIEKEFEFDGSFNAKGFVINDIYLVFYGLNNICVIDRKKQEIIWRRVFAEEIILKPLIYSHSLYLSLDYDKIISIDLLFNNINWQYSNDVDNLHLHTNTTFIQSDIYLFYINSNRMHIINKYTGLMFDRVSIAPRHKTLTNLRNPRIKCIELYNNVIYICYDNGILLAYDIQISSFLWQKTFFDCESFVVYKKYILSLRKDGLISLINKYDGKIVFTSSNLVGIKFKKIIFLNNIKSFFILGSKSVFIVKLSNKKLYFDKPISIALDDIMQSSSRSIFFISKNKTLKECFFK